MFASSFGDVTICLRCQLRLARTSRPGRSPRAFRERPRPSRQIRQNSTASVSAQVSPDGDGPRHRILYPHGRLRGSAGRRLRENVAPLGVEALGRPAEVLVLRDAGPGFEHERDARVEEITGKSISAKDLLHSMGVEKGILVPEDVRKVFEEFKSQLPHKGLSWEEWLETRKQLCKAFNVDQLAKYSAQAIRERLATREEDDRRSNILQKSTWTPGTTPFRDFSFDGLEKKQNILTSAGLKRKEALADRILRDCWDHHVQADEKDTGELEILLRPQDLSLLVHESRLSCCW